jgi:hypothetical protein
VKTKGENTPDVVDYRTYNDYFKYLVTVIEVYRKYAWIVPMKSHKGNCIVDGLCSIIGALKPRKLWSIMVVNFHNETISEWLQNNNIDM